MVWPALIAGASVLGASAINARSARKTGDQNAALQREFAQYGIRWKVDDAKAAGLHPLYAMGASTNAASPSYQSSPSLLGQAGQAVASNLQQGYNRSARNLNASKQRQVLQDQIQLETLKARSQVRVDAAQANYYNAMAAAARGDGNNTNDPATFPVTTTDPKKARAAQQSGAVKVVPKEVKTTRPGAGNVEAGENALFVFEVARDRDQTRSGIPMYNVRLNDEAAEAYGDLAAPIINAAATGFYYVFQTVPQITKNNWKHLVKWYFKNLKTIHSKQKQSLDKARRNLPPALK